MDQLERHQRAILQIRKALTGDIHGTSDLLEDIATLKSRVAKLEFFIIRNSDPYDMNEEDVATFHEIGKRLVPQNY